MLAERVAPKARILAVDISGNNVRMANALFAHPRVTFQQADATEAALGGTWQYVIFPDVYEHIPIERRPALHVHLASYLTEDGRILLTCPTTWHQDALRAAGSGLQIVDEDVNLGDVSQLAIDVKGFVSLFRTVSIWHSNDYFHAIVDRRGGTSALSAGDHVFIKAHAPQGWLRGAMNAALTRTRLRAVAHRLRRMHYTRKLKRAQVRLEE